MRRESSPARAMTCALALVYGVGTGLGVLAWHVLAWALR
jgi:hypothetical protein